ncbi:lactaldehyde dehydrogenase/glycolaldehyde dehydrogenase [Alkalihalobacillus xiaoxiensis]|uniref:Lactaldehyde dehydrogenase/glycolaldehyde dehydrogenase n=1 Tax=Shouchella xiaoxiensis TaxID=766895 RepID=A0ABS2SUY0_9BACI|nr:aldehyde dehydrogenase [Shouchella xiaoxiensis]MBM7839335.1 lactaldehyde dehydrogenase/glycolaldehyde dehydrogenase [Shouchella xiaoxiensis]
MNLQQLYINGTFIDSKSTETIDVINPATEKVISQIVDATAVETNQAIEAAWHGQKEWEKVPQVERGRIVRQIGDEIAADKERFAKMLSEEQGKPIEEARGEVDQAVDFFYYMSEWNRKIGGEIVPSDDPNEQILIQRKAIGVVAGIIPWNYPVFIFARKVATALITGCSVVIKPSEETPNTAIALSAILDRVGLPKGVYNLVTGKGDTVGNQLSKHPKVAMVSMTGSVAAGTKVMEAAAQNITKVNLELGGKAPIIVSKYADLDLAVKHIKASRIENAGQACISAERVYVQEDVAEAFTQKMIAAMQEVKVGYSLEDNTVEMGPVSSEHHLEKIETLVNEAIKQGAKVETGGTRLNSSGYFYAPTVLTNVRHDFEIMTSEVFGPVLPITTYKHFSEAIDLANDSIYGLASALYSNDYNEIMQASRDLQYGETYVNRDTGEAVQGYHAGMRQSGIGGTDGKNGLGDFLSTHVMYLAYNDAT